jgi:glycosyltransferase involved in cell wall biosynthesis
VTAGARAVQDRPIKRCRIATVTKRRPSVVVACLADVQGVGGGATLATSVSLGLAEREYDVRILSLAKNLDSARQPKIGSVPVTNFTLDAGRAWRTPQLVWPRQLQRVFAERVAKPGVLIAVSPFFIQPARKRWPDIRIVYLFPCLLWRCLPKTWEGRPTWLTRFNRWLVGREERRALDASDVVVVQSKSVVRDVLDFHPRVEPKLTIMPTGVRDLQQEIRTSRFDLRREWDTPQNAMVAMTIGHLDRNKNVGAIIEAFHRCAALKNSWLWVCGNGPAMTKLKAQAVAGSAADRIRFLGHYNNIPDVYAAADMLIHAAWYDNFPNVYLEAMVSAMPIIGPKSRFPEVISPLEDIIENGVQGELYDLLDPDGLTSLLHQAAACPERIKLMGEHARQLALQKYRWDSYINAVEQAVSGD